MMGNHDATLPLGGFTRQPVSTQRTWEIFDVRAVNPLILLSKVSGLESKVCDLLRIGEGGWKNEPSGGRQICERTVRKRGRKSKIRSPKSKVEDRGLSCPGVS